MTLYERWRERQLSQLSQLSQVRAGEKNEEKEEGKEEVRIVLAQPAKVAKVAKVRVESDAEAIDRIIAAAQQAVASPLNDDPAEATM